MTGCKEKQYNDARVLLGVQKMDRIAVSSFLTFTSFMLCGCAGFEFYDNPELGGPETGIKFYTAKPYILVSRTGAKDKPVEIQVQYLPDISNPLYANPKSGWGSADLSLALSNGMLTTFGQKTDPKLNELITSLGSFASSLGAADKAFAEAGKVRQQAADLGKASAAVSDVAGGIGEVLQDPELSTVTTKPDRDDLGRIQTALAGFSLALKAPGAEAQLPKIVSGLEAQTKQLAKTAQPLADRGEVGKRFWGRIDPLVRRLQDVIDELKPKQAEKPTVSLYELVLEPGPNGTANPVLREVPIHGLSQ